jgi:HlyD family secretion protein
MLQSRLSQAQKQYDDAVRLLNNLLGETNVIDLEQAEADLTLAQARCDAADYQDLKAGPDPDEVALARARLANATAQVTAARDALQNLELRAPFAGKLIASDLKVGEFVSPGVPVATLADLSAWQVQTIDLAESDVALLSPGMAAEVTLDAFPGERFTGAIREIDLQGVDRRGDITYTVTLDFDPGDVPVRWEMTAFVDISLP